jgi:hypothetical protein
VFFTAILDHGGLESFGFLHRREIEWESLSELRSG